MRAFVLCAALGLLGAACAPTAVKNCSAGQTATCTCTGGAHGTQSCQSNGTFGACSCGTNVTPDGGSPPSSTIPSYAQRSLANDAPYIDVNSSYAFQITVAGTGWGVIGLTTAKSASNFEIDLYDSTGKLVTWTTAYWDCGGSSPNKTGFIALNGIKEKGKTYQAVINTGGSQYTVEWYESRTSIPWSNTDATCTTNNEVACEPFPTGHVAHTFDVSFLAGNNYGLYHSSNCGCPGVSAVQSFQFLVDSGGVRGDYANAENYVSVAPTCSSCGSDQVGIAVDATSDPIQGVVAIDTTGQAHQAVDICYRAVATACSGTSTLCNGQCVNAQTNANACGASCTVCSSVESNATGYTCSAGTCGYTACTSPWGDCDGNPANGCETYLYTKCGYNMNVTQMVCSAAGACDYTTCNPGYLDCDGNRTNGCETNCTGTQNATPICNGLSCSYSSCNSGWSDCDLNRANGCEFHGPTCPTTVASGLSYGTAALAVDSTNAYWSSWGSPGEQYVAKAGGTPSWLGSVAAQGHVAIDGTYFYWQSASGVTPANELYATPKAGGTAIPIGTLPYSYLYEDTFFADGTNVYWTDGTNVWKWSVSLQSNTKLTTLAGGITALTADSTYVYFYAAGILYRVPIAGGSATGMVNTGGLAVYHLAVDGTQVYLADATNNNRIYTYPFSQGIGGSLQTLSSVTCAVNAFALDATNLYVGCSGGSVDEIAIASGTLKQVASNPAGQVTGVAIDATKVYYSDIGGYVESVPK